MTTAEYTLPTEFDPKLPLVGELLMKGFESRRIIEVLGYDAEMNVWVRAGDGDDIVTSAILASFIQGADGKKAVKLDSEGVLVADHTMICRHCGTNYEPPMRRGKRPVFCSQECREAFTPEPAVRAPKRAKVAEAKVPHATACRDCGGEIKRSPGRGRPPVRCVECRSK